MNFEENFLYSICSDWVLCSDWVTEFLQIKFPYSKKFSIKVTTGGLPKMKMIVHRLLKTFVYPFLVIEETILHRTMYITLFLRQTKVNSSGMNSIAHLRALHKCILNDIQQSFIAVNVCRISRATAVCSLCQLNALSVCIASWEKIDWIWLIRVILTFLHMLRMQFLFATDLWLVRFNNLSIFLKIIALQRLIQIEWNCPMNSYYLIWSGELNTCILCC